MSNHDEPNLEDEWQDRTMAAVRQFGLAQAELHATNPWPDLPLLPRVMNHVMTELWDHGFSQSEIRVAFENAITDLSRYAGGEEARS